MFPLGQSDRERSLHHFLPLTVNTEGSGEEAEPRRNELTADSANRSTRNGGLAPPTAHHCGRDGVRRRRGWIGQPRGGAGRGREL